MDDFQIKLSAYFQDFSKVISSEKGDWTVKGFIDIYKNIYTISIDTKVVSKIVELMIFPVIVAFAKENNYEFKLSLHQNHYPDITFIEKTTGEKIALDLKSTYRISKTKVNGMTLGAFTGYFRNRESTKNATYPYSAYSKHYILGVIYTKTDLFEAEKVLLELGLQINSKFLKKVSEYLSNQSDETFSEIIELLGNIELEQTKLRDSLDNCVIDEKRIHSIDNLEKIQSVVRDFEFFVQEKWKIATDRPGSGNTKNIGSANSIIELKEGKGLFTKYPEGKKLFDDFWMNYLTKDMAQSIGLEKPHYNNLLTYFKYKNIETEV